ncbi:MAG: hypothetical protein FD123_993 [Bacteroidetes bacterium]|nr:MAG: hypothetical protein FD123_993 [Bacteroidota bacterium]
MHFSTGQVVFLLFFVVVFIAAMTWAFLRDKSSNDKHYKGAWKILLIVLASIVTLSMMIRFGSNI